MAESALKICRICLQQIEEKVQFYFLNNEIGLMLQSKLLDFLPEIDLNVAQNPIICNRCTTTIDGIHEFKQLCLRTETIIKDLKMQQKPFEEVLNYIKKDTVYETIKEEFVEDIIKDELDNDCFQVNTDLPVYIEVPTKPLFYCYTCNYNTDTKRNLARHVHTHRLQLPKIRQFKCNECSYMTPNNDCWTAHKIIHLQTESIIKDSQMQQKPFDDILNYVKKDTVHETFKEELVEDTIIHEPQIVDDDYLQVNKDLPMCIEALTKPLFYCYTCNYNTDTKRNLVRHVHTHRLQPHQCNICDYKCATRYKLTVHMRSHTNEKLYKCAKSNYRKPFVCGTCSYSCRYRSTMAKHMNRHSSVKNHKCGKCDYTSAWEQNVKNHMTNVHYTETANNLKCDKCDYSAAWKQSLKRHMINMHYRETLAKNHKCDECDYSSVLKCNLKRHVIRMHNKDKIVKNHKCGVCEYATRNKATLVKHIRSHTGEKPYK